jgi:hypothetical protein
MKGTYGIQKASRVATMASDLSAARSRHARRLYSE